MAPHPKIYGICIFNHKYINLIMGSGFPESSIRVFMLFLGGSAIRNSFQFCFCVNYNHQKWGVGGNYSAPSLNVLAKI